MSWKRFILGVGLGIACGLIITTEIQKEKVSPEKILKLVKQNLNEKFHITGSWIHMIPESFEKNEIEYTVYRGGITTTNHDDEIIQYDFVADAKTGTILELTR